MTNDTNDTNAQNLPSVDTLKMKVVAVAFPDTGDQEFHYYAPLAARPGQWAVVYAKGKHAAQGGFSIGRIAGDVTYDEGRVRAAILGAFDEEFAQAVQARMDHLAQVKARLLQKKREFEERELFSIMAKTDPEAAALLDELKKLQGV